MALVCAAIVYLAFFVPRGWIPHDEGMIGRAAEWVLSGGLPHVDYQEPYTGGLSMVYAAVFKVAGIDLIHLRWVLFAVAAAGQFVVYAIARRFLRPIGAAMATWVALGWSFPNYFAAVPSWFVLVCALAVIWALLRHLETGAIRYVVFAGLAAGLAIVIKQTGVYLAVAMAMALVFQPGNGGHGLLRRGGERFLWIAAAAGSVAFALLIMRRGLGNGEVVYLLLPILAVGIVFGRSGGSLRDTRPLLIAALAAALPLFLFLVPYVLTGQIDDFVRGAILLPQKRVDFASYPMPPAPLILLGVLLVALVVLPVPPRLAARGYLMTGVRWAVALTVSGLAVWSVTAYQFIWQAARAVAALIPLGALWLIHSRQTLDSLQTRRLYILSSMLAWASLVQFPYGFAIYFCYVAPLAVIAGIALADAGTWLSRSWAAPAAAAMLVFAIAAAHPSYITTIGAWSAPQSLNVPLNLERAHLKVTAQEAERYRRLIALVKERMGSGSLVAGPDTPEVYFLTERSNSNGALFDFFSDDGADAELARWIAADVVVLNRTPSFSDDLSPALIATIRQAFPHSETIERFEVRWR